MKKKIIIILIVLCSVGISAQSSKKLLNSKIENLDLKIIKKLQNRGYISSSDSQLFANYIVTLVQENNKIDTLTYSQLIDKFSIYKRNLIVKKLFEFKDFGKDSIFFGTPEGNKIFIGMGELSLEKLVERESKSLPEKYLKKELNERFGSPNQSKIIIAEIMNNLHLNLIFGNIVRIKSELGENISKYRLGDYIEIANRIMNSNEFKPIIEDWKNRGVN